MTASGIETSGRKRVMAPWLKEALAGYLFISPWIIGFLFLTAGPMIASFGLSLFKTDLMNTADLIGLDRYVTVLQDKLLLKALKNTAYYTFAMVPLSTTLALMIAVLLNQGIKLQSLWRTIYYLPSVVSGIAVSLLFRWLFQPSAGLFNALLAQIGIAGPGWIYDEQWAMPSMIMMSLWGSGGAMVIFLAGLRGIPTALYEAAEIDGAGPVRSFFTITLPMLSPTILFNMVMNIIGSFQIFTQAFVLTDGGPANATLTMVLYLYRKVVVIFSFFALRSSRYWVHYSE